ncbi:unnamed protein product [Rotaria socialis]|uniref:Reverse transcriptase domain-containing protein n=2 Tax=Rotaria socialis TaxID=392032 RepID=A0A818H7A1_9BILA|nr:unnamed protein product [Rotaria socialis]CAF3431778.1 unnamed protein product [Rotaria socialis]CAF3500355.1 unnamed protein product [Rotaria socialis]CAF4411619.1 unnamed protein product [Rotaria socialis]
MNIFQELYNINSNCIITNARGKQLQLLNEGFIECVDDDSTTFEKNEYEAKLDWILGSQPLLSFITNVETHPTIGSINGHKPLTFDIQIGAEPKPTSPRLSLNFKEAKWAKFRSKLDRQLILWNNDLSLNSPLDIEDYSMFITDSIMLATKEAIPTSTPTSKSYALSEASKSLITLRHQAYQRWKRTGVNIDKRQYYNSKILLTNSLRNDRIDNINKLMSSLCHKKMYSDKVWLTVRKFHSKRIKQTFTCNNTTASSDKEKAELFANYFENDVYSSTDDTLPFHDQVTSQASNTKKKNITSLNTPKWKQITIEEVKYHIKRLQLLIQHLTKLSNQILKQGHIPTKWKTANIILIMKPKKDKQHPSSYRPISLLSCFGKLLEKIIKQRLMLELERRNILPEHQAGFRPGKSTIYNILRLERYAQNQLRCARRHSAVILFDIKVAFDSVWHNGLIYKLNDLRLPKYIINYLTSFLKDRTASIEIENVLSKQFHLKSGTPQGSPLSPLLYIIYTADSMNEIPTHTEH